MTHNSEDLRVRRTRKLLKEALISLIEEEQRNFEIITVAEIAERAMVSRAAFYRYYHDKYDLVEQIFAETMKSMVEGLDQLHQQNPHPMVVNYDELLADKDFPPAPWVLLFEHVAEYKRLYRTLLSEKGSPWFRKNLRNYLANLSMERIEYLRFHRDAPRLADQRVFTEGFIPQFIAGQIIDTITWWLENDQPYPPKQIAGYCQRLIIASLREANQWK
jgi:AcrR family transcriptional regulator